MTKRATIYFVMIFSATVFAFTDASAQKYPERRMARDGGKAYAAGDFEAAETAYRHALEVESGFREATFNLGNALFRQQKVEEAAKAYTAIATDSLADPKMVSEANFNLGNVMLAGQKIDEAIELYKQALRIDPTDEQAKYNLAYAQKLKQEQENKDQNQDQNQQNEDQDQNGGGENDQNQDQNKDRDQDQNGGNNENEGENKNNEGENEDENGQPDKPEPQNGEGAQGEAKIDPQTASQMLDAVQEAEDDTREKVNAREVQTVPRSGKNW